VPQLILIVGGLIAFIIAIIGWIINSFLSSIEKRFKEHADKVEIFIQDSVKRDHNFDLKISKLEDHVFNGK